MIDRSDLWLWPCWWDAQTGRARLRCSDRRSWPRPVCVLIVRCFLAAAFGVVAGADICCATKCRNKGLQQKQGQIYHCAGCTMGGGPRRQGAPDQLPDFYHTVWTFRNHKFRVGLNVTMTTKKRSSTLWGKKSAPLDKKSWLHIWEKGPHLTLVWGPRMINLALVICRTLL